MPKPFGDPLPLKADNEVILPESERWEISDETRRKIEKIEANRRNAAFMARFIRIG